MEILVTGGMGYIGSHTVVELIKEGYTPVIVDNLSNSNVEVLNRINMITGVTPEFIKLDVQDEEALSKVFASHHFECAIHFAGLKAVGESVEKPIEYYDNNINSSISLIRCMLKYGCKNIIFSSSATVYGEPDNVPLFETDPVKHASSPYGETKIIIEQLLKSVANVHKDFNVALLRYFNPVGAHESGLIGEDPKDIPNNLMPYVTQVAVGVRPCLHIFGDDYPTRDGSCIRDYIHVVDLALGHVAAIKKLLTNPGLVIYNLGTGRGTSVFEIVHAFEKANNLKLNYDVVGRRAGDVPENYADASKAFRELHWKATRTIEDCCKDAWHWQSKNPNGYRK